MANQVIQSSFASGELSPGLYARVDLDKYHAGAALLRNFFVDYRGGARNRAGTKFCGRCYGQGDVIRLVPFTFNVEQSYALEFGALYMRVLKNRGYVTEPSKNIGAITQANPAVVTRVAHGYANGDWVYLVVLGMTELTGKTLIVSNVTADTFRLNTLDNVPINSLTYGAFISGTVARIFTLTTPYVGADLFKLKFNQSSDTMTITGANYAPRDLTRTQHWAWSLDLIVIGTAMPLVTGLALASSMAAGATGYLYAVTAINDSGDESLVATVAGAFASTFEATPNSSITVSWTAVTGAVYYNIYRANYALGQAVPADSLFGVVGSTKGVAFVDKGYVADFSFTPPNGRNPLLGNNPATSTYFQQRKVYAASANFQETFWMSQVGLFNNFNVSIPVRSSDAVTGTLASLQTNTIRELIPMPGGLIAFTIGGVWQISGDGVNSPVTASSIVANPQAYNGIGFLKPIPVNFDIIFVQAMGSIVRDLSYNFFANIYSSVDLTVLSSHLFLGHSMIDMTFAEEPWKIFWFVRDDGKMLSLTYMQEQEVFAWAQHDTLGFFRSACSIPEKAPFADDIGPGDENVVYVIVERYLAGRWIQYTESLMPRTLINGLNDAWFLDCGIDYPLVFLAGRLYPSAVTGNNILFVSTSAIFSAGMVGSVIRFREGFATIKTYISTTQVRADILQPFPSLDDGTPIYAKQNEWTCTKPVDNLSNLDHLEGKLVSILADGGVVTPQTVVNGRIDLPQEASRIIVGLPYKQQLGTLYLDLGQPTVQGKRKTIPAVTARVEATRGLKAGPNLVDMTEYKILPNAMYTLPSLLETGDMRIVIGSQWGRYGQVFFEQPFPLPASILGVIPEVEVGDN